MGSGQRDAAMVAIDLGAPSGSVISGRLDGGTLRTREVGRFPNRAVQVREGPLEALHWDCWVLGRDPGPACAQPAAATATSRPWASTLDAPVLTEESRLANFTNELGVLGTVCYLVEVVHVVGGDALNTLLCQLTTDATGLSVVARPTEATAYGNLLVQACATGALDGGLDAVREVAGRSCDLVRHAPRGTEAAWDEAERRLTEVVGG